jgi:hypothetical protein
VPDAIYQPTTYTPQDLADVLPAALVDLAVLGSSHLPPELVATLRDFQLVAEPMLLHAMVLACFASLVAPFGEWRG